MLKEQAKEEWNIDKWEAKSHLKISSSTAIVWNSMTSDGIEWKVSNPNDIKKKIDQDDFREEFKGINYVSKLHFDI